MHRVLFDASGNEASANFPYLLYVDPLIDTVKLGYQSDSIGVDSHVEGLVVGSISRSDGRWYHRLMPKTRSIKSTRRRWGTEVMRV